MKKIWAGIICVTLVMTMTACGSGKQSSNTCCKENALMRVESFYPLDSCHPHAEKNKAIAVIIDKSLYLMSAAVYNVINDRD